MSISRAKIQYTQNMNTSRQ